MSTSIRVNGNSGASKPSPIKIEDALAQRSELLKQVLPKHITPERLIKVALLARSRNPLLLKCTTESFLHAIMQCAEMGLEPSGSVGGAHLVPFLNRKTNQYEATCIPDYRGLIDLARRSGQIRSIEAHTIYANEKYTVRYGSNPVLEHEPLLTGDPGDFIAVYAVAKLADGATQVEVMTRASVDRIRARSRAKDFGPWVTDFDSMAKKTVLRQLCKYLPRSRELQQALDLDDSIEADVVPLVDLALPADVTAKPTRADEVKAKLKAKTGPVIDVRPDETEEQAIVRAEHEAAAKDFGPPAPSAQSEPPPPSESDVPF